MQNIDITMENIIAAIRPQLIMLALIYSLVLVVIVLDLWAGVRKARQRCEFRSSYGYRKTVEKIGRYFNMIFVITAIDGVQMLAIWQLNQQTSYSLPLLPIFTFFGAIFVGFIELKSVYEKSEDKERAKIADAASILSKAIKDHDTQNIIGALIEYMKTDKTENKCHEDYETTTRSISRNQRETPGGGR